MNYANKSFSVAVGGAKYAEGYDRVFGKKEPGFDANGSPVHACDRCGDTEADVELGALVWCSECYRKVMESRP
jgi:hypothetical protein